MLRETLVLHPGALGDLILALPAIDLLREADAAGEVTIAGNVDFAEAVAWDRARRIGSLSAFPLHRLFAGSRPPPADIELWRSYSRIVCWTGSRDAGFRERFAALHPEVRVAAWRPAPADARHVCRVFIESLGSWVSGAGPARTPTISLRQADRKAAAAWLSNCGLLHSKRIVALHPGAGSVEKRWPLDRYRELCARVLRRPELGLVLAEGPAEPGLAASLARELPQGRIACASGLPLRLLAGILSHAHGYAGNDSGVSHLAAGLGIPSVVIFGPTEPRHWAPPGGNAVVASAKATCPSCSGGEGSGHTCLSSLATDAVWAAGEQAGAW